MKHKTADLEGALLDAAVAKAEGLDDVTHTLVIMRDGTETFVPYGPSTHWALGGPIIERERIALLPFAVEGDYEYDAAGNNPRLIAPSRWWAEVMQADEGGWIERCPEAFTPSVDHGCGIGATPLIAAMRAYVASKLGEEIDL